MTQRERIREDAPQTHVGVYEADAAHAAEEHYTQAADQIRWGPVIAGIFTVITSLLGLSVLGLAIGLSAFDASDPLGPFGIGAGIWGIISALLAFGLGGYLAGATSRVRGGDRGLLNGAMVWMVTIPLTLFLLGSGLGALVNTATNAAGAAGAVVGGAAGAVADDPAVQATAQAAQDAAADVQPPSPAQIEQASDVAGRTAWGTLLWLGLGAAAAMGGGFAGGKVNDTRRRQFAHRT